MLPWNILILSIGLVLGLTIGVIVMPVLMFIVIASNCVEFRTIMKYWSRKNRFKGDGEVKVHLIEAAKKNAAPARRLW
jgi:hypothetical protein